MIWLDGLIKKRISPMTTDMLPVMLISMLSGERQVQLRSNMTQTAEPLYLMNLIVISMQEIQL